MRCYFQWSGKDSVPWLRYPSAFGKSDYSPGSLMRKAENFLD